MKQKEHRVIRKEETISCLSHFLGFALSLVGTGILLSMSRGDSARIFISLIYGVSMSFLFLASALYHFFKREENEDSFWRKLDHTAIFFMIAGTYTPVCYMRLMGHWRWGIILIQWVLVFGGIFFKFFYLNAPRFFSTLIYLFMGWVGVIAIRQFFVTMSKIELLFLILGGASYTIGALFYIFKWPKIRVGFGFHEIFHIFILIGAFFHYLMIYHMFIPFSH